MSRRKSRFDDVQVMGDGLLVKMLLEGEETIVEAMKKGPQLSFEIEKRLVPYTNLNKTPTMILRATIPQNGGHTKKPVQGKELSLENPILNNNPFKTM